LDVSPSSSGSSTYTPLTVSPLANTSRQESAAQDEMEPLAPSSTLPSQSLSWPSQSSVRVGVDLIIAVVTVVVIGDGARRGVAGALDRRGVAEAVLVGVAVPDRRCRWRPRRR
jgi:hypothetical protein